MMTAPVVGGKTPTDQKGVSGSDVPPPVPSRTNHNTGSLLRDNQVSVNSLTFFTVQLQTSRPFIVDKVR